MAYLPSPQHDNSDNISMRQITRFHGYNHNKVIRDYEFFDMENMCGKDYPAISTRNGRSLYDWGFIAERYLRTIQTVLLISYRIAYAVSAYKTMTFEEYLSSKGKSYVISYESYAAHIKETNPDFYNNYFERKYNGSIDFDGLVIVMGSYVYYRSYVLCEVADSSKVLVPIGDKIAVFPDKIILNMARIKDKTEKFSDYYTENQTDAENDFFSLSMNFFSDCIESMDAERTYVTTGNAADGNLIDNTDFSSISASISGTNGTVCNLNDFWSVKSGIGKNTQFILESCTDSEKGNCLKVELSAAGTIHGIYQKVNFMQAGRVPFRFSFWVKAESSCTIRPYISAGSIKTNLGKSVTVGTSWQKITVENTISVDENGFFIVSLDGIAAGGARTVYFAMPECERVLTDAETACNVDMTHYTLSGFISGTNLAVKSDFSDISDTTVSGLNGVTPLGSSWKMNCSVGAGTQIHITTDSSFDTCLICELSAAATIRGIYQEIAHENAQNIRIRFSFWAKSDRVNVPIKPYISGSNTVAVEKGKTVYLSTEWQKVTIEKTINVTDQKFTVSFEGIAAGSSRKVWFSTPEVTELKPKDISTDFKVMDAVHLKTEFSYDGQIYEAEHDAVIYNISDDGSVLTFQDYALLAMFPEDCVYYEKQPDGTQLAVPAAESLSLNSLVISRKSPDIDFACSCHNKIWGINKNENVIYASAYNDASNWNFFEGIAADSFYGECTSPGRFTGAISYGGYPLFFKERGLVAVYGKDASEFYISEKEIRGVEEGSEQSLVCMNEALYYKSFDGMMRFSGGLPESINEAFGHEIYHNAVSGVRGSKMYVSMLDKKNESVLFVYDAETSYWYKEDPIRASGFVFCENKLRLIEENSGDVITMDDEESDEVVRWFVESGDLYDSTSYKKYIWRFLMRIGMHENSEIRVYLQYNADGVWELQKEIKSSGRKTFSIPLQCKRTDHMRMRIEGIGKVTIYSIARRMVTGSDI